MSRLGGANNPMVTVITAAYNWSSVLRHAVASVLAQSFADFEMLVVGDCCTDDSESIVGSFADQRLIWHNLEQNHGSQSGPNNAGLQRARGRYIAYLGQDDLWWPTHLMTLMETAHRNRADVVAALALLSGPPKSGILSVTGHFPGGPYEAGTFFPPSSMLHTADIGRKVGGWRSPDAAIGAVDYDLLVRFNEAGARFASTGDLTVFKPIAALRRDAYRLRDDREQAEMIGPILRQDERFRVDQLIRYAKAVAETRQFNTADMHRSTAVPSAIRHSIGRSFKGLGTVLRNPGKIDAKGRIRFFVTENSAFEWHAPETSPVFGSFRWSGPSRSTSFALPAPVLRRCRIKIHVLRGVNDDTLEGSVIRIDDQVLPSTIETREGGDAIWTAVLDPEPLSRAIDVVTIDVPRTARVGDDKRWLGLAIGQIALVPF